MEEKPRLTRIEFKIMLFSTIAIILVFAVFVFLMFNHIEELTAQPLIYGAQKLAEQNGEENVMCTCKLLGRRATLSFNQYGFLEADFEGDKSINIRNYSQLLVNWSSTEVSPIEYKFDE
jgi:hypothetical protein